jgi:hypothetical protein
MYGILSYKYGVFINKNESFFSILSPTRRLSPHQKPKYRSNQWKKNHDKNPNKLVVIASKLTAHYIINGVDIYCQSKKSQSKHILSVKVIAATA